MLTAIAIIKGNIIRIGPYTSPPPEGDFGPEGILIQAKAVAGKGRRTILVPLPEPPLREPVSVLRPPPEEAGEYFACRRQAVGECTQLLDSVRLRPPVLLGKPPRKAVVAGEVRVESECAAPGNAMRVRHLSFPFSTFVDLVPEVTFADGIMFTGEWEAEAQVKAELAQLSNGGSSTLLAVMLHISVEVTETCLMRICVNGEGSGSNS